MKTIKNKIKKIAYGGVSFALLAPLAALAQWNVGINNAGASGLPGESIWNIIRQAMNWLLGIVGFLGVIGFAISGILYLTAAGDEDQIAKAKKAMLMSIVGVIVALVGFVIIRAVDTWLGGGTQF